MNKILSLIIPTYNMEEYLPCCMKSITSPIIPESLEVIAVNDGSTDNSLAILRQFEAQRPDIIRIINKMNGNYGSCINAALPEVKGKYVKILDADDWFDTDALCKYVKQLDGLDCDVILTDYTKMLLKKKISYHYKMRHDKTYDSSILATSIFSWVPMHAVTFRSALLRDLQYKQTEGISYTDLEWIFYPYEKVKSVRYIPLNLYQYRLGREGQTMDPKVMNQRIGHNIKIAYRMLERYSSLNPTTKQTSNAVYMKRMIIANLRKIYKLYLLPLENLLNLHELSILDNHIKNNNPDIYYHLETIPIHPKVPYRFIKHYHTTQCKPPYCIRILNQILKNIQTRIL